MPLGTVMMTIPGVLSRDFGKPLVQTQPIVLGQGLFHALRSQYRMVLVSDASHDHTEHWLRTMGLIDYQHLITSESVRRFDELTYVERRMEQLELCRGNAMSPELVIDPSPEFIAEAMLVGATGLLFASPAYARSEFDPDAAPERDGLKNQWSLMVAKLGANRAAAERDATTPVDVIGD